jgi:hypothetical protein
MKKLILFCVVLALLAGGYYLFRDKLPWKSSESESVKYSGVRATAADELTGVVFFDHRGAPKAEAKAQEATSEDKRPVIELEAFCCVVNPKFADAWKKESERLDAKRLRQQLSNLAARKIIKLTTMPGLIAENAGSAAWNFSRKDRPVQSLLKISVTPTIQSTGDILMDVATETSEGDKKIAETTSTCKVKPGGSVVVGNFIFEGASNILILKADLLR